MTVDFLAVHAPQFRANGPATRATGTARKQPKSGQSQPRAGKTRTAWRMHGVTARVDTPRLRFFPASIPGRFMLRTVRTDMCDLDSARIRSEQQHLPILTRRLSTFQLARRFSGRNGVPRAVSMLANPSADVGRAWFAACRIDLQPHRSRPLPDNTLAVHRWRPRCRPARCTNLARFLQGRWQQMPVIAPEAATSAPSSPAAPGLRHSLQEPPASPIPDQQE